MFSLFSAYPTFMIFLGVAIAMVITMVLMPAWIRFLKTSHIGQQVRADGPQSHLVKQGTPTMGGVIMLIAVIVFTLLASVGAPLSTQKTAVRQADNLLTCRKQTYGFLKQHIKIRY